MPIARLHSIAVSLILHAGLLGLAARSPSQPSPRLSLTRRAALETIAIDAANGWGHPEAAAPAPPTETAAAGAAMPLRALGAPAVPRAREHRVRPARAVEPAPPREVVPPVPATNPAVRPAAPVEPPAGNPMRPSAVARAGGSEPPSIEAPAAVSGPVSSGGAAGGIPSSKRAGAGDATSSAASANARAELLARYAARVRARVEQHREYPYLARRANLEGTICLRISIGASGGVLGVTPTCGASHEPLLAAALKSVSSAAPFPPLPAALGGRLTLDVPVVFRLDAL
jgi:periplasmic protein TonB